jgi:hypothetical protein
MHSHIAHGAKGKLALKAEAVIIQSTARILEIFQQTTSIMDLLEKCSRYSAQAVPAETDGACLRGSWGGETLLTIYLLQCQDHGHQHLLWLVSYCTGTALKGREFSVPLVTPILNLESDVLENSGLGGGCKEPAMAHCFGEQSPNK